MSVATRVSELATRIAAEIKALKAIAVTSPDGSVKQERIMTKAAHTALATKDASTVYYIRG